MKRTEGEQQRSAECAECARLERERAAAREAGDLSKATDCCVLLKRHPEHGNRLALAEEASPQ